MLHRSRLWGLTVLAVTIGLGYMLMGQTGVSIETSGQVPYLASNSTQSAFTQTAGRFTTAPASPLTMFPLGPASGNRFRGVEITFYGAGSATQTYAYKVWAVRRGLSGINGTLKDYEIQLYCSGTVTLGTTTGSLTTGPGATTSNLIADTITLDAAEAFTTKAVAAYGGTAPLVFSPGSNGMARLYIPDLGNSSDIIVEFDMTGATSGNCYIERGT